MRNFRLYSLRELALIVAGGLLFSLFVAMLYIVPIMVAAALGKV